MREKASAISLNELLDLAIANGIDLLIETKHPVLSSGSIEKAVIELLKQRKRNKRCEDRNQTYVFFPSSSAQNEEKFISNNEGHQVSAGISNPAHERFRDRYWATEKAPKVIQRNSYNRTYVWTVNSKADLTCLRKRLFLRYYW